MLETPILFLVFNRPDTTKQTFQLIRKARPFRLYVAADGPRSENEGEVAKIEEVRRIATAVDWDCEVMTLFCDNNLGCKMAVSGAITWFFEHEEEGIILEDDCVVDPSFFPYCESLLAKYRHDTRIMAISGDNFQKTQCRDGFSYYFSRYPHCWGWATWKRAWRLFDRDLVTWPGVKEKDLLYDIGAGNEHFVAYWRDIFDQCHAGRIDSWAYPWTYSCWIQRGLTVLPAVNLVSNIGFSSEATHTNENSPHARLPRHRLQLPLSHPPCLVRDFHADSYTDRHVLYIKSSSSDPWNRGKSICKLLEYFRIKFC